MIVLVAILGFLVGLVVSHHYIVVPLWGTEAGLRKELKDLRTELYLIRQPCTATELLHRMHKGAWVDPKRCAGPQALEKTSKLGFWFTVDSCPKPSIPHRAHSDVLKIGSIEALIEGTK